MVKGGCVYIITNKNHTTLYTGVTNNLHRRISEHKNKNNPKSFASRYNCEKLVYYRVFATIDMAIAEEKRIKGGSRAQKIKLIEEANPNWIDLFEDIDY